MKLGALRVLSELEETVLGLPTGVERSPGVVLGSQLNPVQLVEVKAATLRTESRGGCGLFCLRLVR